LMMAENLSPFCSSEIFLAAPVFPLKNASQLAVICALALPPAAGAELLGAAALLAGADGDVAEEAGAGADALADGAPAAEVLELLHAATVAARARPTTGTASWRARSWNRITRLLGALSFKHGHSEGN
jgi:hypothetical protein